MAKTAIEAILRNAVNCGVAPGFSAAWLGPDGYGEHAVMGARGADNSAAMQPDTLFWIASFTKAITTVAVLQLVERGVLSLDEAVGIRLPALAAPKVLTGFDAGGQPQTRAAQTPITIRHLLTHTSGLAYEFCNAELARYCAATGTTHVGIAAPDPLLMFEPGTGWQYGIGPDWAGKLIEQATGQSLADYFTRHIFEPLGMTNTTFFPDVQQRAGKASVHARLPDGSLMVIPHAMPAEPHFSMGGGGLYSTAPDYLKFLAAILNASGKHSILNAETIAVLTQKQVSGRHVGVLKSAQASVCNDFDPFPSTEKSWSLGFVMNEGQGPAGRAAGSLAWAGLANCYYWADPERGVAGVLFAQLLPFADARVLDVFADFERAVYQSV